MTRIQFLAKILTEPVLQESTAPTTIEACAPVFYEMPKPCNGQCPACGKIQSVPLLNISAEPPVMLVQCLHCSNAFVIKG